MLLIGLLMILQAQALSSGSKVSQNQERITFLTINRISQIVLIYSSILSINLLYYQSLAGQGITIYQGLFKVTSITQSFDLFVLVAGFLILQLTSSPSSQNVHSSLANENIFLPEGCKKSEYPLIVLFNLLGGSFLLSCNDLVSMFLSLELQSYCLYILATMNRDSKKATSGGLKYFLLGGFSSAMILLSSGLIYASTGLTNFQSITILLSLNHSHMQLGIPILILMVGYLFKMGAAPFHFWSPDVYDGQPTTVTVWLAVIPKISILIFLSRFLLESLQNSSSDIWWFDFLILASFLSLLIGTILGLSQYRIKRLLAYSTISHLGFLLLALQIHSCDSLESFLFYLIQYTLSNINIFFIVIGFGYLLIRSKGERSIDYISQLKGQFVYHPYLSLCFFITLFSFAGIPPFIGFFGKQMVLLSAVKNGYIFLAFVGIITSVISASYYLKLIKLVCFDKADSETDSSIRLSDEISYQISILTLIILLFLLKPDFLLNSAHLLALTNYYY